MPGVLRPTEVARLSALLLTAPALGRAESAVDPSRPGPHPVAMVEVTEANGDTDLTVTGNGVSPRVPG